MKSTFKKVAEKLTTAKEFKDELTREDLIGLINGDEAIKKDNYRIVALDKGTILECVATFARQLPEAGLALNNKQKINVLEQIFHGTRIDPENENKYVSVNKLDEGTEQQKARLSQARLLKNVIREYNKSEGDQITFFDLASCFATEDNKGFFESLRPKELSPEDKVIDAVFENVVNYRKETQNSKLQNNLDFKFCSHYIEKYGTTRALLVNLIGLEDGKYAALNQYATRGDASYLEDRLLKDFIINLNIYDFNSNMGNFLNKVYRNPETDEERFMNKITATAKSPPDASVGNPDSTRVENEQQQSLN